MTRVFIVATLILSLAGASGSAQTPPSQTPPPKPPPAQEPSKQTPPAQPPKPAPEQKAAVPEQKPAQPPAPFPDGARVAAVDLQRIANESVEGKAATAKLEALRKKRTDELNEKNKALQANQQKLLQQGGVLSPEAQSQLQKEIDKQQVEIQRFTQDAQKEVEELQQELQLEFQKRLFPILQQVAAELKVHMLFSVGDAGIIWVAPGIDITEEVIRRFNAVTPKK